MNLGSPTGLARSRTFHEPVLPGEGYDTNFSLKLNASYTWQGNVYWDTYWEEHRLGSSDKEQLDALWASIGNQRSFVLTRASLCNLLRHVGFTSVYECFEPLRVSQSESAIWLHTKIDMSSIRIAPPLWPLRDKSNE
jgi:hypothetical protein